MSWASLNAEPVITARVTIPYYGRWVADVALAVSAATPSKNALVLGDLTLTGYTFRSSEFAGQFLVRLAGGEGGWGRGVPARDYDNPGGILLSLVLRDVAREVGESVVVAADQSIGVSFVRESAPASRVLRQLAPAWWVAPDGSTHVGPRDVSAITSHFDVIAYDGARGEVEIATEVLADWTPGRTISAPTLPSTLVLGAVTHTATNEGASRLTALVAADQAAAARLFGPLQALEREDEPRRTFGAIYEYVVQEQGPPVHAVPADVTIGLPNVVGPLQGLLGGTCKPTVGSTALLVFLNGDPNKPRFLPGALADEIDLAFAEGRVARDGDVVTVGTASGMLTITSSTHTHGRSNVFA